MCANCPKTIGVHKRRNTMGLNHDEALYGASGESNSSSDSPLFRTFLSPITMGLQVILQGEYDNVSPFTITNVLMKSVAVNRECMTALIFRHIFVSHFYFRVFCFYHTKRFVVVKNFLKILHSLFSFLSSSTFGYLLFLSHLSVFFIILIKIVFVLVLFVLFVVVIVVLFGITYHHRERS